MNNKAGSGAYHHHCSKEYYKGTLDEYHFRFKQKKLNGGAFNILIERMMQAPPSRLENIQK